MTFGAQIESATLSRMATQPDWHPPAWVWRAVSRMGRYALGTITTMIVACCLFYFAPYRRQRLRFIWPGAAVATAAWFGATLAFAWYVRHMAGYNVMYGSIGTGIALLVWMYLLAAIALIACEFNVAYERIKAGPKNADG